MHICRPPYRKLGRGLRPLLGRGCWVPIQHKVAWAEACLHAECHLDQCSRLATINIGRFFVGRGAPPPFGEAAGSPSNIKSPGLRSNSIPSGIFMHPAVWTQWKWAEIAEGAPPRLGRRAGYPSNTKSPELRPTSVRSTILIHPAVLAYNKHGPKILGAFLGRGSGSPVYHKVAWDEAYLDTEWHLDPPSHLAATDMGRKLGGSAPILGFRGKAPVGGLWDKSPRIW